MKLSRSLVLGVAALAVVSGCTTTVVQQVPVGGDSTTVSPASGRAPIIASFDYSPKSAVGKNDFITFTLVANDPSGQPLQYNWATTRGRLTANTGATVAWQPMKADGSLDAGLATVTVIVSNGVQTSTGSVNIQINADGTATISQPPVTNQPGTTPTTNQPGTTPVTNQPGTTPVTNQPGTTPVTNPPVTNQPGTQPTLAAVAEFLAGVAVGHRDGTGTGAKFNLWWERTSAAVGVASDGKAYVADLRNGVIRKIDLALGNDDAQFVTTVAGSPPVDGLNQTGYKDGTGAVAKFHSPMAVLPASNGNLIVFDASNGCFRQVTPSGVVSTYAGAPGNTQQADGGNDGRLFYISTDSSSAFAIDKSDNIYFFETKLGTSSYALRKLSPDRMVTTLAGGGSTSGTSKDGTAEGAGFLNPSAMVVDSKGVVYVSESTKVRKVTIDASGNGVVKTWIGTTQSVSVDGDAASARFALIKSMTIDKNDNIYVADGAEIRKISPDGTVSTVYTADKLKTADGEAVSYIGTLALDGNGQLIAYTNLAKFFKIKL